MLIQFTVGNFLSFYKKRTLNLEATSISELKENIIINNKSKLLPSIVIYGANSSGKSNLLKALQTMRSVVLSSVRLNKSDELTYTPFSYLDVSEQEPTFFEIIFWCNKNKYRYGFEYNQTKIINEWLFTGKTAKIETALFIRTEDGIGVTDKFKEGAAKESATNDNRLFISLVAQLGGTISNSIIDFFSNYNILSGLEHNDYTGYTTRMLQKKLNGFDKSLLLYQNLKLGFKDIEAVESNLNAFELHDEMPEELKRTIIRELTDKKQIRLKTIHNKFDKQGNKIGVVMMDKSQSESEGTNKIIDLSGPIFDTLNKGKILIIDELDAKLHPLITIHIIDLFNKRETNPNNAQLIFATHDTNLLNAELFRRDQIWFTEKDEFEQTDLYSLHDFNLPDGSKVRNDSNIEKNYIRGRYGAIPFITN